MTAAVSGFGGWLLHLDSRQKQHQALMQRAEMLVNTVNYAAPQMTDEDLRHLVSAQGQAEGIKRILLVAGTPMRVIASTQAEWIGLPAERLPDSHAAHLLAMAASAGHDIYHFFADESELHFAHPLPTLARHAGDAAFTQPAVLVFLDASRIRQGLLDESRLLALGLCGLLLLLGGFSYGLIHRLVLRPTAQITEALGRLAAGERHVRAPTGMDHEIGQVARSLNRALDAQEQAVAALRDSETRHRLLADNANDFILIYRHDGRICYANPALRQALGDRGAELAGQALDSILTRQSPNPLEQAPAETAAFEIELDSAHGPLLVEATCTPLIYDGEVKEILLLGRDIRERKAAETRIQYLAHHDALTGLPNRLLLQDRFEQALAHAARGNGGLALLFIDLDHFKTINDSLGHSLGDQLLQQISERLHTCLRIGDTLSRQGGDEFIVVLPDIGGADDVAHVAERLLAQMEAPLLIGEHALNITLSLGASLYPEDGRDMETLMKKADIAMYHAKSAGRNAYRFFTTAMNSDVLERMQLESRLRHALANQELHLHYQPQVDIASGRTTGVEVLLRWTNPELGEVSPGRFIPVAESSGLIIPIGGWVLREACRQGRRWIDLGLPPLVIAINISVLQLQRGDFVKQVEGILKETQFPAHLLELELTESALIEEAATLHTLQRLKALGIQLSIDDFGTGYSNLAYLHRLAVDKLKIDQSFIRDLSSKPEGATIVKAIVQMAQGLSLTVIAEGVETPDQAALLLEIGCPESQGYHHAKPMDAAAFAAYLQRQATYRELAA
jgi:diguanylate cyclase (GGDEF)-like protein/PAS domain S-box-containing protein